MTAGAPNTPFSPKQWQLQQQQQPQPQQQICAETVECIVLYKFQQQLNVYAQKNQREVELCEGINWWLCCVMRQCPNCCGYTHDSVWTTVGTSMTVSKLCDMTVSTVGTSMTVSKLLWAHPWQCQNYCGHTHDSVQTAVGTPMTVSKLLWADPWQCLNYCGHIHDCV